MENAAEALKMAGGMLIAISLIALIVYVFDIIGKMESTKVDQEVQKQIVAFNQKFNAFDKSLMYGTDVISAMGLAISNNKIYNAEKGIDPLGDYYEESDISINIAFRVLEKIKKVTELYEIKPDPEHPGEEIIDNTPSSRHEDPLFETTETYDLDFQDKREDLYSQYAKYKTAKKENPNKEPDMTEMRLFQQYLIIENLALNREMSKRVERVTEEGKQYQLREEIVGYDTFKKQLYGCEAVKQNQGGRIYYMEFKPQKR